MVVQTLFPKGAVFDVLRDASKVNCFAAGKG